MKKITLIIGLTLIMQSIGLPQGCLPEGITFTSQEQIDNFQFNYPDCTEIEGFVEINGSDITNLNGLIVITTINGYFQIGAGGAYNNLIDLTGLGNLTTIGGALLISENDFLSSLSGLDNLTSVGKLVIRDNDALTNLTGLDNLTSIGDVFNIWWNDTLQSLSGLNNLTQLHSDFSISGNPLLANLNGLENIESIEGEFYISGNNSLTNLIGLDNLTTIDGKLSIGSNNSLTTLSGMDNLTTIQGELYISFNISLTSLSGIENINPDFLTDLYITDNDLLSECDIENICEYLTTSNGYIEIAANAPGCNNQEQVEEACDEAGILDFNTKNAIAIYPNPTNNEIFIESKNSIKIREVNIYNQVGQRVLDISQIISSIDISMLQQGMYVVEVVTKESKIRKKLIIR